MQIDPKESNKSTNYRIMRNLVVPRPIVLVSTLGKNDVVNVAPFSFFGVVSAHPPVIGISFGSKKGVDKDTLANARRTGELVTNMVTEGLKRAMVISAMNFPPEESEVEPSGISLVPGTSVRAPRIAESPAQMECRVTDILEFGRKEERRSFVMAEVVMFHVQDEFVREDGLPDHLSMDVLGRLGDDFYRGCKDPFELKRISYETWKKNQPA